MKVVGITNQQEFFVGSKEKNFRINEFLIVEDKIQGDLLGQVVEAQAYNRYIPLSTSGDFVDSSVIESLKQLGYNIDEETIYIAKLRLLNEALYPVETGADLRIPQFKEIKKTMIKCPADEGFILGAIRNTDAMINDMEDEFKDLFYIFEDEELKKQNDIPYILDKRSLHHYPHIGVFGGSGSGKSFGLRVLLEEVMSHEIPTIVLDPHYEMDFKTIAPYFSGKDISYENKFKCLHVGKDVGVKFEDLSTKDLKNLLNSASQLSDSMNNVVDILFNNKDSLQSFTGKMIMLTEAQEQGSLDKINSMIDNATGQEEKKAWERRREIYESYDKICPYSSVKGIIWRLKKLEGEGIFSKDIKEIENGILENKMIIIQGSTRILQVFSNYLLSNIYGKRREYKDALYKNKAEEQFPPFMIVTDEAHNFAPKGYDTPSKQILKEIAQEGRKYGVFLILATQRPTLLDETITAQLNTKFIFRTVRASDIQTIKEETDLTAEETKRLPYLTTGDVFISSAVMGRTIYARIRAADTVSPHTENPFDELKNMKNQLEGDLFSLVADKLPVMVSDLISLAQEIEREKGKTYSVDALESILNKLVDKGYIEKEETVFGHRYKSKEN